MHLFKVSLNKKAVLSVLTMSALCACQMQQDPVRVIDRGGEYFGKKDDYTSQFYRNNATAASRSMQAYELTPNVYSPYNKYFTPKNKDQNFRPETSITVPPQPSQNSFNQNYAPNQKYSSQSLNQPYQAQAPQGYGNQPATPQQQEFNTPKNLGQNLGQNSGNINAYSDQSNYAAKIQEVSPGDLQPVIRSQPQQPQPALADQNNFYPQNLEPIQPGPVTPVQQPAVPQIQTSQPLLNNSVVPNEFAKPVDGSIISKFGAQTNGRFNDGVSISAIEGSSVNAAAGGKVIYTGNELKNYGNLVIVKHENGFATAYGHLAEIKVGFGDTIQQGQEVGTVGRTGSVNFPQLLFIIRKGKNAVDPLQYLNW